MILYEFLIWFDCYFFISLKFSFQNKFNVDLQSG